MDNTLLAQITFEIGQIDRLFETYGDVLARAAQHEPDHIELAALASVLHSFYNGLENIFLSVAKRIDREVPEGTRWHQALLAQMTKGTAARPSVLTPPTSQKLVDYLAFRHFYRHSYTFILEWNGLNWKNWQEYVLSSISSVSPFHARMSWIESHQAFLENPFLFNIISDYK